MAPLPFSPGTKRFADHDDDDDDALAALQTPHPEPPKKPRTPQSVLGSARKLFVDDAEDMVEISAKLKHRLSSAMTQIPPEPAHFSLGTTPFGESPTKAKRVSWQPSNVVNVNLAEGAPAAPGAERAARMPKSTSMPYIPTPDDDTSAHQALLAAITRQRRKRRSFSHKRTASLDEVLRSGQGLPKPTPQFVSPMAQSRSEAGAATGKNGRRLSLPPLTVALDEKTTEQDAVYSLMSLSSPRGHSRQPSTDSGRLPPIVVRKGGDDDVTDIDEDETEDEEE
ncbi:hypothetical protein DICA4_D15610 [Diutina catenulata]